MDPLSLALLAVGLVLLLGGAELFVSGAAGIARSLGIPPVVVGLTVVALGTSSPEMAVSIGSSLVGEPDLALGNVVGSNIYNILLILGLTALASPFLVDDFVVTREVPLMILASVGVALLAADGSIGRMDGLVLVAGLLAWVGWLVLVSTRKGEAAPKSPGRRAPGRVSAATAPTRVPATLRPPQEGGPGRVWQLGQIVIGLALLVAGAQAVVRGAVEVAYAAGLSQLVVGLTIVAVGTSLPELATSFVAAMRGERGIAVGNIVGSNLFNLGAVLGMAALLAPGGVPVQPTALSRDLPVMVAVAVASLPLFFTGRGLARWEGGLLLGYAVAYTILVLLAAMEHPFAEVMTLALVGVAFPLTIIALGMSTAREILARRAARERPGGTIARRH